MSPPNRATLYLLVPNRAPAGWREVLDPSERERHARFKFDADAQAFLATHGLLRHVLSRHVTGVAPADWRFTALEHGKPVVTGRPELHFNVSHCRELVVVAIGSRALGVDVEPIDPRHATDDVARRVYGPRELADLERAGSSRTERFFTRWALKEAWVKATGVGLHDDLPSVELELGDGTATLPGWAFRWWARDALRLAVCVEGDGPLEVDLKEWP